MYGFGHVYSTVKKMQSILAVETNLLNSSDADFTSFSCARLIWLSIARFVLPLVLIRAFIHAAVAMAAAA